MKNKYNSIGQGALRKDAWGKVTGATQYGADIQLDHMRYGKVVRSPFHHAELLSIDTTQAEQMPGIIAVLTADDIPGAKDHGALIQDQPALAYDRVRHMGEPVALVIGETAEAAEMALSQVKVKYKELPFIIDPEEALNENAPKLYEKGNLMGEYHLKQGDFETGLGESDIIIEKTFELPSVSPAYMETELALSAYKEGGSLTVWVSSQRPFEDRHEISEVLSLPQEKIRVKCLTVGGGFGGKEDSELPILAALAAWNIRGNVQIVNSRNESMLAHPKRHAARFYYKAGINHDGKLNALSAKVFVDTGAYASLGPAVGGLLTEMVPGSYHIPNIKVDTYLAYTNRSISGAMRGFGGPQSNFGLESMIDELAEKLRLDAIEIRRRNIFTAEDHLYTGVPLKQKADALPICLDKGEEIWKQFEKSPVTPGKQSGIGIAIGSQTMGLGAGVPNDSGQRLEWLADGSIRILAGAPELGQGLTAVMEQVVSEKLGLPYDKIHSKLVDSKYSLDGAVTCASSMTYLAGNALIAASDKLITKLLNTASEVWSLPVEALSYKDGILRKPNNEKVSVETFFQLLPPEKLPLKSESIFSFPYPEEITPKGHPIGIPHVQICFGIHITRVEVDPLTGQVDVKESKSVNDVGHIINRKGVEGQIEGGVAMGLGYALMEEFSLKSNQSWTDNFTEYLIPTAQDVPDFESIVIEIPEESGPFGAKGVGEMGPVPVGAAVNNAIFNAVGVRLDSLPLTAEKIKSALTQDRDGRR